MISKNVLVKILVNSAIGIFLVVLWLQFVDLEKIIEQLKTANLGFVLPAFGALFLGVAVRALKLKIFLASVKKIALKDLVFLNAAAMLFNFLIPIRAGEVLKGIYLASNYNLSISKSVIWVFLDRFIDFLTVLILAVFLLLLIPTSLNINFITVITIIFLGVIFLAFLMVYKPEIVRRLYKLLSFLLFLELFKKYFDRFLNHLIESFSIFRKSQKELSILFILAAVGYGADAAIFYFLSRAISHPLSFPISYLSQLISALTYLIPAGPGYIGSAEASGLLVFSGVFSIEPNIASALTVLFHIIVAIWVICFGILSIYFLKIKPGAIFRKILKRN